MNNEIDDIIELMNTDILSHGDIVRCLGTERSQVDRLQIELFQLLEKLLETGEVAIGNANNNIPGYVEFVGWNGGTKVKIARAFDAIEKAQGTDKEFAYWLCLVGNVDRFE